MPLRGTDQVKKNIEQIMKERWTQVGPAWWDTIQENIFLPSQEQVPVKTGALKSTGQNVLIEEPHSVTCEVGYGSEAVAYAFVQHERLDFHHETGKAKYLEDPINAAIHILPKELIKRLEGRA